MFRTPALAAVALAALLAAGCGSDDAEPAAVGDATTSTEAQEDEETATSAGETATTAAPEEEGDGGPTATPEAELRADLAALLQEHVYLAGITIGSAVANGLDAAPTTAAADTLDENSVAISEAVSSAFDPEVGEDFLGLWRDHIGSYVDYTGATAAGDAAGQQAARDALDDYRAATGELLDGASEGALAADAVADDLDVHVDSLLLAVDATVAGSPDAASLLREAAGHMPDTAAVLAAGIAGLEEA